MNLMDALAGRRSVRRYSTRPVGREQVMQLLEAAEAAPSAGNLRSRSYVVVGRGDLRAALAVAAYGQDQVKGAPILVVICADPVRSSGRYGDRGYLYSIQDAAAAAVCLLLAAHGMGLGACWNGAFDDQMAAEILGLKGGLIPVSIISIGWPDESPTAPASRRWEEMVRWEMD